MVTLTYPGFYPSNGATVKEHLRRFLQELKREHLRREDVPRETKHSSFWFLEFQNRGAPHFHIFTTWAPDKEWVASRWYDIVASDDVRHLHAGTRTEYLRNGRAGAISYASKYAAKLDQKVVPENYENVGRFWGVSGNRATVSAATFVNNTAEQQRGTSRAVKSLYQLLEFLVNEGRAEVLIRKEGIMVISIHDLYQQVKVRCYISRIMAASHMRDTMFQDAEVDYDGSQADETESEVRYYQTELDDLCKGLPVMRENILSKGYTSGRV